MLHGLGTARRLQPAPRAPSAAGRGQAPPPAPSGTARGTPTPTAKLILVPVTSDHFSLTDILRAMARAILQERPILLGTILQERPDARGAAASRLPFDVWVLGVGAWCGCLVWVLGGQTNRCVAICGLGDQLSCKQLRPIDTCCLRTVPRRHLHGLGMVA